MSEDQLTKMLKEYEKGGKFTDFVNKASKMYGTTVSQELAKATVYEYYESVVSGCNKEMKK